MEEKTKASKENDSTNRVRNYYAETKTLNASYPLGVPKGHNYLTRDFNNSNGSGSLDYLTVYIFKFPCENNVS